MGYNQTLILSKIRHLNLVKDDSSRLVIKSLEKGITGISELWIRRGEFIFIRNIKNSIFLLPAW